MQHAACKPDLCVRVSRSANTRRGYKIGWERFKKRLAEDGLRKPKRTKLMEERHQARLERERAEAKANGSETKPAEASE